MLLLYDRQEPPGRPAPLTPTPGSQPMPGPVVWLLGVLCVLRSGRWRGAWLRGAGSGWMNPLVEKPGWKPATRKRVRVRLPRGQARGYQRCWLEASTGCGRRKGPGCPLPLGGRDRAETQDQMPLFSPVRHSRILGVETQHDRSILFRAVREVRLLRRF